MASIACCKGPFAVICDSNSSGICSERALKSIPAQKALSPAPLSTMHLVVPLSASSLMASGSESNNEADSEFLRSGRFNVIVAIRLCTSTSNSSRAIPTSLMNLLQS
ncbi:MAG: hypothetical protein A2V52_05970 [Actinobacteria bacterium RBG_19FT_COMBO_54_7]|nr:MAG: hypothetical protein A2V52_05970 [Actinobacteria bacterium RBG_19FT_COMBO_54_7]